LLSTLEHKIQKTRKLTKKAEKIKLKADQKLACIRKLAGELSSQDKQKEKKNEIIDLAIQRFNDGLGKCCFINSRTRDACSNDMKPGSPYCDSHVKFITEGHPLYFLIDMCKKADLSAENVAKITGGKVLSRFADHNEALLEEAQQEAQQEEEENDNWADEIEGVSHEDAQAELQSLRRENDQQEQQYSNDEQYLPSSSRILQFKPGDEVLALYTDGKWYDGMIKDVNNASLYPYLVAWDDYDEEDDLPVERVRQRPPNRPTPKSPTATDLEDSLNKTRLFNTDRDGSGDAEMNA